MQRAFLRVEAALDPGLRGEGVAHPHNLAPRRPEQRQRRSGPREQAHVDALRKLGEQVPQHDGLLTTGERKIRREEPAGDVYMRAGGLQLARDHRQRLGPVDQDVDRITRPRRWLAHDPAGSFTVERLLPAERAKPPPIVAADPFGKIASPSTDSADSSASRAPARTRSRVSSDEVRASAVAWHSSDTSLHSTAVAAAAIRASA